MSALYWCCVNPDWPTSLWMKRGQLLEILLFTLLLSLIASPLLHQTFCSSKSFVLDLYITNFSFPSLLSLSHSFSLPPLDIWFDLLPLVGKVGVLITQLLLTPPRRGRTWRKKNFSKHKINVGTDSKFYFPHFPFPLHLLGSHTFFPVLQVLAQLASIQDIKAK